MFEVIKIALTAYSPQLLKNFSHQTSVCRWGKGGKQMGKLCEAREEDSKCFWTQNAFFFSFCFCVFMLWFWVSGLMIMWWSVSWQKEKQTSMLWHVFVPVGNIRGGSQFVCILVFSCLWVDGEREKSYVSILCFFY